MDLKKRKNFLEQHDGKILIRKDKVQGMFMRGLEIIIVGINGLQLCVGKYSSEKEMEADFEELIQELDND